MTSESTPLTNATATPANTDAASHDRIKATHWVAVLLLALILRGGWMLLVSVEPVSDSARYDFFAQRLAQGLGYTEIDGRQTAYWPVGPSFLYALVYRLAGPESDARLVAAAALNLVLGLVTVALTMHLGRKWFSPRVGLAAGMILACWPSQVQFTTVLSSETPMLCFMLAGLAAWYADRGPWWLRSGLAGMFMAAAAFMRPTALLVPAVVAFADLSRRPQRLQTVGRLAVTGLAMAACIAPWTYRNYCVFNAFVPISTNGGVNFWMGNNPESDGFYMSPPWEGFAGEPERDAALKDEAMQYIRAEPAAFLQRTAIKAIRLHERESIGIAWNEPGLRRAFGGASTDAAVDKASSPWPDRGIFTLKLASNVYWWLALLAAIAGTARLVKASGLYATLLHPAILLWAYFTAVHAITVIQDRYHFAAIPAIAMLAGVNAPKSVLKPHMRESTVWHE